MKRIITNTTKMLALAGLILSLTLSNVAMAKGPIDGNKIEVKHIKNIHYLNLIQVDINSTYEINSISLIGPDGKTIYTEKVKGNVYTKKFSLDVNDNE